MIDDYILIFWWLLVAIGAALLLGTGAALLTYRRTGALPGQGRGSKPDVGANALKLLAGALLIVFGAAGVARGMG